MKKLRPRLTYANVMATLAFFIAVGGASAFAATQLAKNSVGTKQLKKNSVTAVKIKKRTITGKQINLKKLGTVPEAAHAASADTIPPSEPVHLVGTPGNPPFSEGATNLPPAEGLNVVPAGFYKDQFGVVHLQGGFTTQSKGIPSAFQLPPGFRPPAGQIETFRGTEEAVVIIAGSGVSLGSVDISGEVIVDNGRPTTLGGISFRAGS